MSKTVGESRRLGGCGVSYGFFLAPDTDIVTLRKLMELFIIHLCTFLQVILQ